MRYYDMPPGNDFCMPYEALMYHVRRGKLVGMVLIIMDDGIPGVQVLTGTTETPLTQENTFLACTKIILAARRAAENADDCDPLP